MSLLSDPTPTTTTTAQEDSAHYLSELSLQSDNISGPQEGLLEPFLHIILEEEEVTDINAEIEAYNGASAWCCFAEFVQSIHTKYNNKSSIAGNSINKKKKRMSSTTGSTTSDLQRHNSTPSLTALALETSITSTTSQSSSPYSPSRPLSTRSQRSTSTTGSNNRDKLPPLFWYMETGDWAKAEERLRRHPREVKTWATLKTKSDAASFEREASIASSVAGSSAASPASGTKRLALHHACFKLRSAGSMPPPLPPEEDPFIATCKFILQLIRLYPEAAGERESRHGCLPLHLASFASCASKAPTEATSPPAAAAAAADPTKRPEMLNRRASSDNSNLSASNLSAVHAEEKLNGGYGFTRQPTSVSVGSKSENLQINAKREEYAVQVINALLDAYPRAIRVDSEGGRLPLHTACAGRATPRVIQTLITAYPAAARHRNKDGFLPLHLAAHWGVSHPNVPITLLKTYPDATVGRNRWERTPLEEALCMAGENGRPHQSALVRALRKHPSFWTRPDSTSFMKMMSPAPPAPAVNRTATATSMALVDVDESLPSHDDDDDDDCGGEEGIVVVPHSHHMKQTIEGCYTHDEWGQEFAFAPLASAAGFVGRFVSVGKRRVDVDLTLPLEVLIQNRKWAAVLEKIRLDPLEPEKQLRVMTRGGFKASTGMSALHYACERSPPVNVVQALIEAYPVACLTRCMPGGCLPLHIACTWYASADVVEALLASDAGGVEVKDELGNLPLHSACFSGAELGVIAALLTTAPKAVLARNHQGSRPIDIVKRLRHDNRSEVLHMLTRAKEKLVPAARTQSTSTALWSELTREEDLNIRLGEPPKENLHIQEPGIEVEVSFQGQEEDSNNNNEELLWI